MFYTLLKHHFRAKNYPITLHINGEKALKIIACPQIRAYYEAVKAYRVENQLKSHDTHFLIIWLAKIILNSLELIEVYLNAEDSTAIETVWNSSGWGNSL